MGGVVAVGGRLGLLALPHRPAHDETKDGDDAEADHECDE